MYGRNMKIGGGGFHHVAIRVKDFDASHAFYTQGLGFRERASWGDASRRLALLDAGDGNYVELVSGEPLTGAGALMHIALRTDNCDMATEAARAAGAVITDEPRDVEVNTKPPMKIRLSFCNGPDGERIEFFQCDQT